MIVVCSIQEAHDLLMEDYDKEFPDPGSFPRGQYSYDCAKVLRAIQAHSKLIIGIDRPDGPQPPKPPKTKKADASLEGP